MVEFLQKVRVKAFARSAKKYGCNQAFGMTCQANYRVVETYENKKLDRVFTVIGKKTIFEGFTEYIGAEEGYTFNQVGYKTVYLVAMGMPGMIYKVLPEDLEIVEATEND